MSDYPCDFTETYAWSSMLMLYWNITTVVKSVFLTYDTFNMIDQFSKLKKWIIKNSWKSKDYKYESKCVEDMYDYSDDRGPYKISNDEKHVDVDY